MSIGEASSNCLASVWTMWAMGSHTVLASIKRHVLQCHRTNLYSPLTLNIVGCRLHPRERMAGVVALGSHEGWEVNVPNQPNRAPSIVMSAGRIHIVHNNVQLKQGGKESEGASRAVRAVRAWGATLARMA